MAPHNITHLLIDFLNAQLKVWPIAAERYAALNNVVTREVLVSDFRVRLQFNPARVNSVSANVDRKYIDSRPCFLCSSNRPSEQLVLNPLEFEDLGFDVLINPFPIFPQHFTIASREHKPQDSVDVFEMAKISLCLPGMVTFFNGAEAGASAPDHLHLQCGNIDFLPLCREMQNNPGQLLVSTGTFKAYYNAGLPMETVHFVSQEMTDEIKFWLDTLLPVCEATGMPQTGRRNILMWPDDEGLLHTLMFPRKAHRPSCYFASEDKGRLMVSPGAVDMAGVLILPREEDYKLISKSDIRKIYSEVSFSFMDTLQFQKLMLL